MSLSGQQHKKLQEALISEIKPKIGILTALPKEYAAVKKVLENTEKISFSGQGGGQRYLLGEVSTSYKEKHTIVLCLASMRTNIAAIRSFRLPYPNLDL